MSIIQISKIQQRSGNLVDLPQLDEAEFGWASDVKKLYIGKTVPNENVEVLTSYSQISFSQIDGSVGNLNISNVTVEDGQVLAFDGTNWVNKGGVAGGLLTLGDVGNVRLDGGAIGYVLETDGTGNLTWSPKSAIVAYIENVTIGNGSPGNLTLITTTEDNYFIQGAEVTITGVIGTTQLNGNSYYVALETANTFALYTDSTLVTPLNATGYGAFPYTTVSATDGITSYITVASSANFTINDPVVFDGNLGSSTLTAGRVYYIKTKPSGTTVTVSETEGGTILDPGTASGLSVVLYAYGGRLISSIATGAASGTAAGSNTSIQYNKNNFFAGSADFTFNETAKRLTVNGNANVGNLNATGTVNSSRLTSNIANGTPPLTVVSPTRVANLNVERANISDTGYVNTKSSGTFYPVLASGSSAANYELASNTNLSFNIATGVMNAGGMTLSGDVSANNANIGNVLLVGANANVGGNLNVTGNIVLTANLSGDSATLLNTLLVGPNTYITNSYISLGNTDFVNGAPYTEFTDTYVSVQDGTLANNDSRYAGISAASGLQYSNADFTGYINNLGLVVSDNTLNSYVYAYANGTIATQSNNGASLSLANTSLSWYNLAGNGFIANATGLYHTDTVQAPQLVSDIATGTAPFVVTSTTQVANLNVANAAYATNAGTATVAGTVTTNAQPNITSVGSLSALTVTGNISGGNISTLGNAEAGNISTGVLAATGNVSFTGANVSLGAVGNVHITGGTSGYVIVTDGSGNLSFANPTTVGTQPAGSNTQVQYNDAGSLGASSGLTFNQSSNVLQVTGNISTAARLISTIATGTAPLVVTSTTRVANLNVANAAYADSAGSASTATSADYATTAGSAGSVTWSNVSGRPTQVSAFTNDAGYITSAFPSGTRLVFAQTSAPTGWTKDTSVNDAALRVVSGGASSGGSVGFTTAFTSQAVSGSVGSTSAGGTVGGTAVSGTVGSTALTVDQIPNHYHYMAANIERWVRIQDEPECTLARSNGNSPGEEEYELSSSGLQSATLGRSGTTGGGATHTHTFSSPSHGHTFTGDSHNHTFSGTSINLAVKYVDTIIATKN